jgi:cytochrome c oxidase subunit 4
LNEQTQHAVGHVTPLKVYLTIGVALLILTAITVKVSQVHLGAWNAIVALAIATVKGLLVALFFMHLLYDKKIYAIIVVLALVILSLLIALTMADILRRGDINEYEAGSINPQAKIYIGGAADTTGHAAPRQDTTGTADTLGGNHADSSALMLPSEPHGDDGHKPGG